MVIPVHDINGRLNFPSRHPLNASLTKDHFRDADLVICMDARDWEKPTTELASTTRSLTSNGIPDHDGPGEGGRAGRGRTGRARADGRCGSVH